MNKPAFLTHGSDRYYSNTVASLHTQHGTLEGKYTLPIISNKPETLSDMPETLQQSLTSCKKCNSHEPKIIIKNARLALRGF